MVGQPFSSYSMRTPALGISCEGAFEEGEVLTLAKPLAKGAGLTRSLFLLRVDVEAGFEVFFEFFMLSVELGNKREVRCLGFFPRTSVLVYRSYLPEI